MNRLEELRKALDAIPNEGTINKARRRAEAYFAEVWSGFCKRDDRQKQTVVLYSMDGTLIEKKTDGTLDT